LNHVYKFIMFIFLKVKILQNNIIFFKKKIGIKAKLVHLKYDNKNIKA